MTSIFQQRPIPSLIHSHRSNSIGGVGSVTGVGFNKLLERIQEDVELQRIAKMTKIEEKLI
jgi:hypothetical protein